MLDLIISYLAKGLILIAGLYMYVYWMAYILPHALLRQEKKLPTDRGLKKYSYTDGRAIVYQPTSAVQPYISQYILSSNQGEKYIQCKIDESITSLKYEVQAFDHRHRCMHTVEIEETEIQQPGYTRAARLSAETSYVNVTVCAVNDTPVRNHRITWRAWIMIGIFAVAAIGSTMILADLVQTLLHKYIILIIPGITFVRGPAFLRGIPFLTGLIYTLLTLLGYYRAEFKAYLVKVFGWLRYQIKSLITRIWR